MLTRTRAKTGSPAYILATLASARAHAIDAKLITDSRSSPVCITWESARQLRALPGSLSLQISARQAAAAPKLGGGCRASASWFDY